MKKILTILGAAVGGIIFVILTAVLLIMLVPLTYTAILYMDKPAPPTIQEATFEYCLEYKLNGEYNIKQGEFQGYFDGYRDGGGCYAWSWILKDPKTNERLGHIKLFDINNHEYVSFGVPSADYMMTGDSYDDTKINTPVTFYIYSDFYKSSDTLSEKYLFDEYNFEIINWKCSPPIIQKEIH